MRLFLSFPFFFVFLLFRASFNEKKNKTKSEKAATVMEEEMEERHWFDGGARKPVTREAEP